LGLPVLFAVSDLWRERPFAGWSYLLGVPWGAFAALIFGPLNWARHRTPPDPEPPMRRLVIWALVFTWCAGVAVALVVFMRLVTDVTPTAQASVHAG
jgi:hypothetical protein